MTYQAVRTHPSLLQRDKEVRLPLSDELRLMGITPMDAARVRDYKRKVNAQLRPGVLAFIGPFVAMVLAFLSVVSLYRIRSEIHRQRSENANALTILVYGAIVIALAIYGRFLGISTPIGFALQIPMLAAVAGILVHALTYVTSCDSAVLFWSLSRISLQGHSAGGGVTLFPQKLSERAEIALQIPGTRLLAEHLGSDPFLIVARGWGPWRQLVYIGAWNTGDSELDSF